MKKVFSVLAVAALFASVVACGQKKAEEEVAPVDTTAVEAADTTVAAADSTIAAPVDSTVNAQ